MNIGITSNLLSVYVYIVFVIMCYLAYSWLLDLGQVVGLNIRMTGLPMTYVNNLKIAYDC